MGARVFKAAMIALVFAVLLAATPFPGALIGLGFGFAVAFFVAGPSMLAVAALQRAGWPVELQHIIAAALALYGLGVAVLIHRAGRAWRSDTPEAARLATLRATFMAALPLMAWLSSEALVKAWRI